MLYLNDKMRILLSIALLSLGFTSCVSKKKYNELFLEKEKAESKTEKLNVKLNKLQIYQQHLEDSLNQRL
jgi:cell division protein FtsL